MSDESITAEELLQVKLCAANVRAAAAEKQAATAALMIAKAEAAAYGAQLVKRYKLQAGDEFNELGELVRADKRKPTTQTKDKPS